MNLALWPVLVASVVEGAVEAVDIPAGDVSWRQYGVQTFHQSCITLLVLIVTVILAWFARSSKWKEQGSAVQKEGEENKDMAEQTVPAKVAPRTLVISGFPERVDGTYTLQEWRKNGREVWQQDTETRSLVMYCMEDGYWGVTKAALIDGGSRNFICSEEPAMLFPHEQRWGVKRSGELRWLGSIHVKMVEETATLTQKDKEDTVELQGEAEEVAQFDKEQESTCEDDDNRSTSARSTSASGSGAEDVTGCESGELGTWMLDADA
jgi:hypothetical protein